MFSRHSLFSFRFETIHRRKILEDMKTRKTRGEYFVPTDPDRVPHLSEQVESHDCSEEENSELDQVGAIFFRSQPLSRPWNLKIFCPSLSRDCSPLVHLLYTLHNICWLCHTLRCCFALFRRSSIFLLHLLILVC